MKPLPKEKIDRINKEKIEKLLKQIEDKAKAVRFEIEDTDPYIHLDYLYGNIDGIMRHYSSIRYILSETRQ